MRKWLAGIPDETRELLDWLDGKEEDAEDEWGRTGPLRTGKTLIDGELQGISESVNTIPSGVPGPCRRTLVVAVGASDSYETLENRVLQAFKHVSYHCKGTTRNVVFYVTWWNAQVWATYGKDFASLGVTCILKMRYARPQLLR